MSKIRTKFVRHRDLKMKGSEIEQERRIQKLMCEGVCDYCREKVQWKFNYDKYKPLRHPATCQDCKLKTITKAYRTLCDKCSGLRKVCPGCCEEFQNRVKVKKSTTSEASSSSSANDGIMGLSKGTKMDKDLDQNDIMNEEADNEEGDGEDEEEDDDDL